MKVYEAVYKEGDTEGVYALSVVENPAMEDFWVTLSEQSQTIELARVDEERRLLLGAALIPNKKIYRNIDGNEFYITFSDATIETLSHNFFKTQKNNNSSLEHKVALEGMSVVESWIVQDPEKDKSNAYGKTYEKGTWVAMMKVDNDEMWAKVKNNEIKGFSIDALLGLQELNLNLNKMEDKKSLKDDILDGIKALFNEKKVEEVEVQEEVIEAAPEAVVEVETSDRDFDVDALKKELSDAFGVQFTQHKEQMNLELAKKDEEIKSLKAELNKKPEVEDMTVSPEVKKRNTVSLKSNKPETMKDRVFENLANTFWN